MWMVEVRAEKASGPRGAGHVHNRRRVLLVTRKKHHGVVSAAINGGLRRLGSPDLSVRSLLLPSACHCRGLESQITL